MTEMFNIMTSHDILAEVQKEIAKLSDQEKSIVELFYFQGNSIRQIAERLNIGHETAKKARFRALAKVRAGLRERKLLTVLKLLLFH
jgi:RNA polymerase sigma factor (sigma-70 family)